ncbi:MAG: hypothetical protein K5990_01885 [Oscillospiraceae bacterium]|nr:hypothetical protein [Oscillospiraceae bacterium]MCR4935219.1 hypothetical protein [Oscillospiraceae bacterium]
MALIGVFRGTHIETDQTFPQGQQFLLIPIDGARKMNPDKARMIQKLYGSVPDSGYSYESVRQERRERL